MIYDILADQFFLIFLTILTGLVLGKVRIGEFQLGSSGTLFTGLFWGWLATNILKHGGFSQNMNTFNNSVVSKNFFYFALMLFISAIGLLAGKDIGKIFKKYGFKFLILGFFVTFVGMIFTLIFKNVISGNKYNFLGIFAGALTSSPGLAAALGTLSNTSFGSSVGYGYALGYIPGVLVVVISMHLLPVLFKINGIKHGELPKKTDAESENGFDFIAFSLVIVVGILIGNLKILSFSLGLTGGILTSSLLFGYLKKVGSLNFSMNSEILNNIKTLGLLLFLSTVGLRYGFVTITSFNGIGILYMFFAFLIASISIFSGFLLGKFAFKMDWDLLAGALCGGMTSTPGLGAALDNTKSNETVGGYGATYPFALLGMVMFVMAINLL